MNPLSSLPSSTFSLLPVSSATVPLFRFIRGWLTLVFLLAVIVSPLSAFDYYVSPSGNDSNSGTQVAPFATISHARDVIRLLKSTSELPIGGITIWLRAGYYNQSSTLIFTSLDSGTASSPITYSAYPKERAYITGAVALPSSAFELVGSSSSVWSRLDPSAQGNVYCCNLPSNGITNYGTIKAGGFELSVIAPLELFCNGDPMTLARWPNANQPLALIMTGPSNTQFTYTGSRPTRWSQAQNIWMHGLWDTNWADFQLNVASINTTTKTITLSGAAPNGISAGQSYYAYNLLEEIDEPGEYYLDRATGFLYIWPNGTLPSAAFQVSVLEDCLIQLNATEYITLRNITLEATRGPILQIVAGNNNLVVGCLLRNCGQYAAKVTGSYNGLDQCEIADSGEDGVILGGGSRSTLIAGNNFITNSRLHRAGRISWAYHPAVGLSGGCGNIVKNNLIDELPHAAVLISGNNHSIENNEISRVCQLTSDAGAIYSGRDWGYRGIVISNNYIHHIQGCLFGLNMHGVYLDDMMSSAEVFGNVLYEISGAAIMCGGGRDNIMTNNIIAQCGIGHYNGDYARSSVNDISGDTFNLLQRLADDGIQYQSGIWASAYPSCAAIPNSFPSIEQGLWRNPQGCVFSNNVGWSNTSWMTESDLSGTGVFAVYSAIANNNPNQPAMFDEAESWDRSLRPSTLTASVSGFIPVPFASIGPSVVGVSSVILSPPTPVLETVTFTNSEVDMQWTDDGIHAEQQESGFVLQRQNAPNGQWQAVNTFGPDVDYVEVTELAPSTTYSFRILSFNAEGSVYSNVVTVTTLAPGLLSGTSTIMQAATDFTVIKDIHLNGTVEVQSSTQQSGPSVQLLDAGDTIQISFVTGSGLYSLAVRVRSGFTGFPTYYWPLGYQFEIDGSTVTLAGDSTSLSAFDSGYGGSYWGSMNTGPISFSAGIHVLQIVATDAWAGVDYIALTVLAAPKISTFLQWQEAHFSADQLADPTISGWDAMPAADGISNLLKYALCLNPWVSTSGSGVQVTLVAGEPQLTFSEPAYQTDLIYHVEVSNDQSTWTALSQADIGHINLTLTIQATEKGQAEKYIRFRATCQSWTVSTGAMLTGAE